MVPPTRMGTVIASRRTVGASARWQSSEGVFIDGPPQGGGGRRYVPGRSGSPCGPSAPPWGRVAAAIRPSFLPVHGPWRPVLGRRASHSAAQCVVSTIQLEDAAGG